MRTRGEAPSIVSDPSASMVTKLVEESTFFIEYATLLPNALPSDSVIAPDVASARIFMNPLESSRDWEDVTVVVANCNCSTVISVA